MTFPQYSYMNLLQKTRSFPHIMMAPSKKGDVLLTFIGTGDPETTTPVIQAEFRPERDISTWEYMLITQMQQLVVVGSGHGVLDDLDMIEYIRRHNLERHFAMSEVRV